MSERARNRRVSKWLRGVVDASPSRPYVRIRVDGQFGLFGCEVLLTQKEARALRERLEEIEAYYAWPPAVSVDGPEEGEHG